MVCVDFGLFLIFFQNELGDQLAAATQSRDHLQSEVERYKTILAETVIELIINS